MDTSTLQDTKHDTSQCPGGGAIKHKECAQHLLPIKDTLEVLSGKWKIIIIMALLHGNKRRFKELQRELPGITGKVLSKELKDLEQNNILTRSVYDTAPITVEYQLTAYGYTLRDALFALHKWGSEHRRVIMGK